MNYSLKAKLSFSYLLVVILSMLFLSIITNIFLEKHFQKYVKQNQEQKNREIVNVINQHYRDNGQWNIDVMETIGVSALENGLIIKIKDVSGKIIWDATAHNNGMCQRIIEHMAQNSGRRYPYIKGDYTKIPYLVKYQERVVGEVQIGSYGPFYLNDNDLAFINTLNKLLIGVGFLAAVFALVIGGIMAKRLSAPISRVGGAAQMIAKGYFAERITEKSNTKEINQLIITINELAQTLAKQEELRKRLTADVAHELRTPAATLQSHLEAMIDGIWEATPQRLQSCHEEIIRINKMIGDLKKLAQYERDSLVLNKEEFDFFELIKRIINNFEREFLNKKISLELIGQEEMIYGDKDKLSQVIINLLSNALKYTSSAGKVEVSISSSQDKTLQIAIKDNGQGISPEDLPYIFERFYRADKSRNRATGGSGIGLTIVKTIVEAHQGRIEVQSDLQEGSCFIVSLPKQNY